MKYRTEKDFLGRKFGGLICIEPLKMKEGNRSRTWYKCRCDCGKEVTVRPNHLLNGNTKSCGCLWQTVIKKPARQILIQQVWNTYRITAFDRGYDFNLSKGDLEQLIFQSCAYCGGVDERFVNVRRKFNEAPFQVVGIDRVDNSIGYTIANCVPCCTQCNYAKRTKSKIEFLQWIRKCYIHSKKEIDEFSNYDDSE